MSTTSVILQSGCSGVKNSDGQSFMISTKDNNSISSLSRLDRASTSDDNISFLGLPFHIWKKIFHHAGVLCSCHIALLPVYHGTAQRAISILGRRKEYRGDIDGEPLTQPDLVTCALQKIPEKYYSLGTKHMAHISMLGVSRMARFITMKALIQEHSFHFELRDTADVDGLDRTLRGFTDMPPLNRELKRLHVNLFSKRKASDFLPVWYYFCDYFGKHLKGTLAHFAMECRPKSVEAAEQIVASEAISNFRGLTTCNVLIDTMAQHPEKELLYYYRQLSEQFVRDVVGCDERPFRFMDLPVEIQMMILEYVLVTDKAIRRGRECWVTDVSQGNTQNPSKSSIERDVRWVSRESCCMCSMLKHQQSFFSGICTCLKRRSRMTRFLAESRSSRPGDFSPVPIFLICKHIHALGGPIFYSRNEFKFKTDELFKLCNLQLENVTFGFPTRHIGRVRSLRIKLRRGYPRTWPPDCDGNVEEYRHLAANLKNAFKRAQIYLTTDRWWKDKANPQALAKVLLFFNQLEGEA